MSYIQDYESYFEGLTLLQLEKRLRETKELVKFWEIHDKGVAKKYRDLVHKIELEKVRRARAR